MRHHTDNEQTIRALSMKFSNGGSLTLYWWRRPLAISGYSIRALEVLREVDLIASEDTRKTSILLQHYIIHKPQKSYHAFNEKGRVAG